MTRRALPPLLRTEDDDGQSKKKKNEKELPGTQPALF